ncbi:DUF3052 family protein [Spongiivirga citrea]|uniref:DUF3052 family protein n=1 Tax=Spongiivirga citrea TaxID=1481457 RepID=A0A6M0CEM6_9FLAO|nr:DUF3052 family protein [Spongiivirga citrea]NER16278.1 DUF3052 family protein [Spongiivirga citrea]
MTTTGYSGTPLAKKLGIKSGFEVLILNAPTSYLSFFNDFPSDVQLIEDDLFKGEVDFIHLFATSEDELTTYFKTAKSTLKKSGMLWISWPKKTSKILTTIEKFDVMKYGLKMGLVDVKVAAINSDWSGHKFVYRKTDR